MSDFEIINTLTHEFSFQEYKGKIYQQIFNRNKIESNPFDSLIKNLNDALLKNKKLSEKIELLERENNSFMRFSGNSSSSVSIYGSDQNISNEFQNKIYNLEKELNDLIKEKNLNSTKLLEILTEKIQLKEQIDSLSNSNKNKQSRIYELEDIVKIQDESLIKLRNDNEFLKKELNKLATDNINFKEKLDKKCLENEQLIVEILKVKNEFASKLDEMMDLTDKARKKKEVNFFIVFVFVFKFIYSLFLL
jgi:hypothetical protein